MAKDFMNIEMIKKYVPHRYPFLLLDRVISFESGKKIVCRKNVSINEQIFTGHFPQEAIFPGVMLIEALAQAAGLLLYLTSGVHQDAQKDFYYFAGINEARFKKVVVPGDQLELVAELTEQKPRHRIAKAKCIAYVDGEVVCTAELLVIKKEDE